MTKYRVWDKYYQDEDDALEIDASNAREAAIKWGRTQDSKFYFWDYNYEGTVVCVLDENGGHHTCTVYADIDPEFHAYEGEES